MKKLTKIILVNWYLFEAEEIAVDGHILVVGPNGSGKTSLQDAVQVCMLGAHGSHVGLNANASKKRERTITGYCLGTVDNENEKGQTSRARDDAITYIVLVFNDLETGSFDTVGVCLSAKSSATKHQTEGLFILPGCELGLENFLVNDLPVTWESFRQEAQRHAAATSNDCYLFNQPEKYIEQMCYTLSPPKRIISKDKYIRSLRRAITLKGIDDVSDFVKNRVLDDWPINVERMRQSEHVYQEMHDAAKKTKERIDELKIIQRHYQRATSARLSATAHRWVEAEHNCLDIGEKTEIFEEQIEAAGQEIKHLEQTLKIHEKEAQWLQDESARLSALIKDDKSEQQRESLQKEQRSLEEDINQQQTHLVNVQANLERIATTKEQHLPEDLAIFVRTVSSLVPQSTHQGLDLVAWPQDPCAVDKTVEVLAKQVQQYAQDIEDHKQRLHGQEALLSQEISELRANHARLTQGRAALTKNTRILMAYLDSNGIKATPICDLATITDPEWQPAIEAYLSNNAEALYVEPEQSKKAISLYRKVGREQGLHGVTVLNPFILDQWNDSIKPNSCASLITSDNKRVERFLCRMTKNLLRVDTEDELLTEPLAITKDGMLSSNGGTKRLYSNGLLKIGVEARKTSLERLEGQIRAAAEQYTKLVETINHLKNEATRNFHLACEVFDSWVPTSTVVARIERHRTRLSVIDKEIKALGQPERIKELKAKQGEYINRQAELKIKINKTNQDVGAKRGNIEAYNKDIEKLAEEEVEAKAERVAVEAESTYDANKASDIDAKLCERLDDQHKLICEDAKKTARQQENTANSQMTDAATKLGQYCAKSEDQPRVGCNDKEKVAWVDEHLAVLQDNVLVGYEERAQEALYEAKRHFRSDVALQLRENIERMKSMLNELNRSLKDRPFSGNEIYSFTHKPAPEHAAIIKYIEEISEFDGANAGSMFDAHSGIDEDIVDTFKNSAEITDYRNLYRYDILIKNSEHNKPGTPLSNRIGSASGGEHQTPYYVSIGASLAAAYRLEQKDGQLSGGFSLALFDEVFEKMDDANSCQAAQYLAGLGLQLFLAAPDSDELKLTPIVDTIIYMRRPDNGFDLELETYFTKPPLKELLKSDSLREHPHLLENALKEIPHALEPVDAS